MKRITALVLLMILVSALLVPAQADRKNTDAEESPELKAALAELGNGVLSMGDKGKLVLKIKQRMKQMSYYTPGAKLSEAFNNEMADKVRQLQKNNKISVTGQIDADFLKLLYSKHCIAATGLEFSDENNYLISYDYTLLGNEQFYAGEDGNIIVIILDTYSNSFFNRQLAENDTATEGLEDFTYYDNYDCCFVGTYPSIVMMLTGYEYSNKVTIGQWFSDAWKSDRNVSFFKTMKEKGYDSYMYSVAPTNCGLKSEAIGLFANYVKNSDYTGKVVAQKVSQDFHVEVKKNGVTTCPGKRFIIQHLYGLHTPYDVDENGEKKNGSNLFAAASGWLTITKSYLEALKEAGVYDNSTIIITADHGPKKVDQIQPIFLIKRAGETHDEMQETNAPVSHREFQSTILLCAGVEKEELPTQTIYDFEEDEDRERTIYINRHLDRYPKKPKYHGTGYGSHNVWTGYTYTGDSKDLVKEYKRRGPSDYIEMNCSFN